ncbi:amiloride-sensitive amine oxidase [copper-containing]-like [Haliotis rufescens]|uniref:amiloride-sensitive amine oxidase [copper-containing]-like n=1 Tax=Haliotis rufescens TaxID=6454 RepID=UPI001EAFCAC1|nr:amiloride-sensitive amine oxidase [copper-containing]-like [Haliotis rufescens]XP_046342810.1 amiloride-sensitive amine oxidase [copper-containing]-like [Haliotis rufescens]
MRRRSKERGEGWREEVHGTSEEEKECIVIKGTMGEGMVSAGHQVMVSSRLWKCLRVLLVLLAIVAILLAIALISVIIKRNEKPLCAEGKSVIPRNLDKPGIFEDLTPNEMKIVRDYMQSQKSLKLKPYNEATLNSSYIYLIDLQLPIKAGVLKYLDGGHREPERAAKVVLYRGDMNPPRVEEYHVGPLPRPRYHRLVANPIYRRIPIPFTSRPVDLVEYNHLYAMLSDISKTLYPVLMDSYRLSYHNCTKGVDCMLFYDVAPRGIKSNDRKSWFWAFRGVEGFYLHPLGFEIQINHESINVSDWSVTKLVYNGQMFSSVNAFDDSYRRNRLKKINLFMDKYDSVYSSYKRRGLNDYDVPVRGPRLVEPDGRRYSIDGQHVQYFGWNMNFRARTSTGLQLFDIRFQGERIAYEISLQDAIVYYTGYGPVAGSTNYFDTSWLLGASSFELMPGVDCPATATFHDTYHFAGSGEPLRSRNAICIFEQNSGLPLRRHYANDFNGGYGFYGGLVDNYLVIRTIANIWNYDYIFDYIFHLNGAVEIKVALTGYVQATYGLQQERAYGNFIHSNVIATLHQHLFHYKIDMDIVGTKNRFAKVDISRETISHPWYPGRNKTQMKFTKRDKQTEKDAILEYDFDKPGYSIIYNANAKNNWGVSRGYRIQHNAMTKFVLDGVDVTQAAGWSKYQMAVTRFQDVEETSSSIYAQNDPFDPVVDFRRFLDNDEPIVDEDLVLWLTAGVHHIPHAEDVPSTTTTGNQYSIFLRPYNYFDECPSTTVSDAIHVQPSAHYEKIKIDTFGVAEGSNCFANEIPFSVFNGSRSPA